MMVVEKVVGHVVVGGGEIQRRHGGEGFEVSQDSMNWNVEENRGGPKSFMQRRRALLESRMLGSLIPES
jgi:hypothetical protein